jgi:hypothetical protein
MRHRESGDIASWLVRHAAHHSPPELASRLEEEWLADLSARRGLTSRLRFGFGCCWARRIIAHEHGAACAAPAGAAAGHRLLLVHLDPSRWSRTTAVVIAVICIHVVLFYAFATGLAQRVVAIMSPPIPITYEPDPQHREQPPPLPPPRFVAPHPEVPTADLTFSVPQDPAAIHVTPARQQTPIPAVAAAPPAMTRVLGGPGAGFPDTDDFYPPVARRLGEVGTATVQVCVDA